MDCGLWQRGERMMEASRKPLSASGRARIRSESEQGSVGAGGLGAVTNWLATSDQSGKRLVETSGRAAPRAQRDSVNLAPCCACAVVTSSTTSSVGGCTLHDICCRLSSSCAAVDVCEVRFAVCVLCRGVVCRTCGPDPEPRHDDDIARVLVVSSRL